MPDFDFEKHWSEELLKASDILPHIGEIDSVACAFNTNIDAIVQITGDEFEKALHKRNISADFLTGKNSRTVETPEDIFCGIFKCFAEGIAEEWTCEKNAPCDEMLKIFPSKNYQMGGNAGIMANLLALYNIKKVFTHTNSLPRLQAEQFLPLDNILGFDEGGKTMPIYKISRPEDTPLVHIIFEFKQGDSISLGGKKIVCPKSNRFIISCDKLNQKMILDENFVKYMEQNPQDLFFLSGFHMLNAEDAQNILPSIKNQIISLKKNVQKKSLFHLEIASTPNEKTRKLIFEQIGSVVDSIGVNDRETIDAMAVLFPEKEVSANIFDMTESLFLLQKELDVSRIQLHMAGIYLTLQKNDFVLSPKQTKNGMLLAARIACSRAVLGDLKKHGDLTYSQNHQVSENGKKYMENLAEYFDSPEFLQTGILQKGDLCLVAVPTPLEKKPKSLVGMGDTISSTSLIGAFVS